MLPHSKRLRCDECRKARNRERDSRLRRERPRRYRLRCVTCGREFLGATAGGKYCARRCWQRAEPPPANRPRECRVCGAEFKARYHREFYCSDPCRESARAEQKGLRAGRLRVARPLIAESQNGAAPPADTGRHLDPYAPLPPCLRCGTVGLCAPGCAAGRSEARTARLGA